METVLETEEEAMAAERTLLVLAGNRNVIAGGAYPSKERT